MKYISIVLFLCLVVCSVKAQEAYCTKIGKGEFKSIHDVCMRGDIILVNEVQVLTYCDFSNEIISLKSDVDNFACKFVGYNRKFRSRVDGELTELVVQE